MEILRTVHDFARSSYQTRCSIYGRPRNSVKRRQMMREAARYGIEAAGEKAASHLRRDYREWQPGWRLGDPIMIGSGRAADWCHIAYLQYAFIARLLHDRLGWTGQRVRDAAKSLAAGINGGGPHWEPPVDMLPTREFLKVAELPSTPYDNGILSQEKSSSDVRKTGWQLWLARVASPAWGRYMLDQIVARLNKDATYHTPSDVVGEVRRLRGEKATDFRYCSGTQYLLAVAERPELHAMFLARAAKATPVKLTNGLEAVYVPFGLTYPTEYDHSAVLGLNYEIRVRKSEWDSLSPTQRLNF